MSAGERVPHNREAERDILGILLGDCGEGGAERKEAIFVELEPEDFYIPGYRKIFESCLALWKNKRPVDFTTAFEVLDKSGGLEPYGGVGVLSDVCKSFVSGMIYRSRLDILKANSTGRKVIEISERAIERAAQNPGEALDEELRQLSGIGSRRRLNLSHIGEAAEDTMAYLYGLRNGNIVLDGVETPYARLNHYLQNFRCGNTAVIAARPGMGKSAFITEIILHAALDEGKKVALFSYEMGKRELVTRMYANLTRVSTYELSGSATAPDLQAAKEALKAAELYVSDDSPTLEVLAQTCRVQKKRRGLDFVCVDHIGLMQTKTRQKDRRLEIEYISRQLKLLAMELDIPVVILCQMNRAIEYGERKPVLSDLRESGAIEQDASQVLFLHRDKAKEKQLCYRNNAERFLELIIAKNRNGAIGTVNLKFECDRMHFINVENDGRPIAKKAKSIAELEPVDANEYDPFANEFVEKSEDEQLF